MTCSVVVMLYFRSKILSAKEKKKESVFFVVKFYPRNFCYKNLFAQERQMYF